MQASMAFWVERQRLTYMDTEVVTDGAVIDIAKRRLPLQSYRLPMPDCDKGSWASAGPQMVSRLAPVIAPTECH